MPADSEPPQLPRTWRPYGLRIAMFGLGGLLVALIVAVWIALDPEVRAQFMILDKILLVLTALVSLAIWHALVRTRVVAREEGLTVVNGYRTRQFAWEQVIGVSLRRGAPWATMDLSDGSTLSLVGIQGSDGARAQRAVRELRAAIAAHTRR